MKTICDKILKAEKEIRFVMIVDSKGDVECAASRVALGFSEDTMKQLGGIRTMVAAGIVKDLTQFLGEFEFSVIKYRTVYLVSIEVEEKAVLFSTEKYPAARLLEKVKKMASTK